MSFKISIKSPWLKTLLPLAIVWLISFPLYAVDVDGLLSPSAQELSDSGKLDEPLLNMIIDHGSKDLLTRRYKVLIIPQQAISDHGFSSSLSSLNQRIRSAADSVLGTVRNQNDFELRLRFRSINVIAADAGLQSLLALAADSSVRQIGLDASGRGGLNQAIPQVNIDKIRQTYGYTGNSIEVAVLDTGIDTDHVDLQGIIASQKCLADVCPNGADNAEDDNGHGTHVSGIIASQGTASPTGAAPGVRIHAVKVLDSSNSFSAASIVLSGLDYVINDLPNVDIVNMSLGTNSLFDTDCDTQYSYTRAFSDAITTLRDRGVLSFVSSMNDASDNAIAAPACIANAIAVGAVYDTQPSSYYSSACNEINPAADTLTCFSNSSVSLDLVAPGSPITSTRRGGGTTIYSGTSMSTPLAAACAALIMEHNSTWSVDEIEAVLETSDVIVTDREGREFPRLDCMGFLKTQDTDGDGVLDGDDPYPLNAPPTLTFTYGDNTNKPIAGITLTLTESDNTVTTLASDANGQVKLPLDPTATNTYTLAGSFTDNGEDPVSLLDAIWILQHGGELRTLTTSQLLAADVSGDGEVDILDAIWILQHLGELRTLSPSLVFLDTVTGEALSETTYNVTDVPSITVIRMGDVDQSYDPTAVTGASLSANGKTLVIGALGNDDSGSNSGRNRIYEWDGRAWVQREPNISLKLKSDPTNPNDPDLNRGDSNEPSYLDFRDNKFRLYQNEVTSLTFKYANSTTPIAGVKVIMTESDGTVTVLVTDANGQITLPSTSNTYTLSASLAETGDDPISLIDAIHILQYGGELRTLTADQKTAADVNADGEVDILDAIWILQHLGELRTLDKNLIFLNAITGNPLSETTFSATYTPSISVIRKGDVDGDFDPTLITDHAPILTGKTTFSIDENETSVATLTATDLEGDALTYSLSGTDASLLSIDSSSGVLTFDSAPDYETKTSYSITVNISDGTNTSTQDLTITITNVNDAWVQRGEDIDGEAANDSSGPVSISNDGDTVAIGAQFNGLYGQGYGHVRIFDWDGSAWVQRGLDIDGEAGVIKRSGLAVEISNDGNTVARSAQEISEDYKLVSVFDWNGSTWVQRGSDIKSEDGESNSWQAENGMISMNDDGNTLAIGDPMNSQGNWAHWYGHARVFDWNGSAWVQRGADIDGEARNDRFGDGVAIVNASNTLAVGAKRNDGNGEESGHVRIFDWDGSAWVQRGLDIDGEAAGDQSGSLSMSSDGNSVAIGAWLNDGNIIGSGHVRVFDWNGSAWVQRGEDIDGEEPGDLSGQRLSISEDANTLAIGARDNTAGNGYNEYIEQGHVRVFDWNGSAWVQRGEDIDGEDVRDESGEYLSMSSDGNTVAIGAHGNNANGSYSGHVRIFDWK